MAKVSSLWSRLWGAVCAGAFWIGLGAVVLDVAVIAPLWMASPPASVRAWAEVALRPEPERLLMPFAVVLALATALAWLSSLSAGGSRRWWLTLAVLAACAVGWTSAIELGPVERALGAAAARDDLALVGLAERWLHWSLLRLGALAIGSLAAHRALVADLMVRRLARQAIRAGHGGSEFAGGGYSERGEGPVMIAEPRRARRRGRRRDDFVWSEEDE
ncbi:MAG: hypothetical protein HY899_10680 [Deltaproteobacteria bacterium]|nr:hypothetical protein [Deltaproteobacteria bacterium]